VIYPWVTGWSQWNPESEDLKAIENLGILGKLQIAVATAIDEHVIFGGGRIPVVVESVGDYIAEMHRMIAQGMMAVLVTTPDFRHETANIWAATVTVQVNENPVVNRSASGAITAQHACEVIAGHLNNREFVPGVWGPYRQESISAIQAEPSFVSYALTGRVRTIKTVT